MHEKGMENKNFETTIFFHFLKLNKILRELYKGTMRKKGKKISIFKYFRLRSDPGNNVRLVKSSAIMHPI